MTQIENNVAMPASEPAKPKPRARRKKAESLNPAAGLLEALKFIAPAQRKTGSPSDQFCFIGIAENWLAASNGILTIGHKMEENLQACPHTLQLIEALNKVSGELSIVQLSPFALSVTSGAFKALIPCTTADKLELSAPDACIAPIGNSVRDALAACVKLVELDPDDVPATPQSVYLAAVLLQAQSAVATNGAAIIEYWHGCDLPPGLLIPRNAAAVIAKSSAELTGFGYSASSVTFWFGDKAFIKTQLFAGQYINYAAVFNNAPQQLWPIDEEFFKALKTLKPFAENRVYFIDGMMASGFDEIESSTYRIEIPIEEMCFNIDFLLRVEPFFNSVNFDENKVSFFSKNGLARGIIMSVAKQAAQAKRIETEEQARAAGYACLNDYLNEIPF